MPPSRDTLARIERLRELFLDDSRGGAALPDYWRDRDDLAAYALVLGARIGWKWDAALSECRDRGLGRADDQTVLDFGCGAGIAAQRFVRAFGARVVWCHDRSAVAMAFAAAALGTAHPDLTARTVTNVRTLAPDVLLVSHVLGELDERGLADLQALIARSRRVVIVEPGNRATSRRLGALRAALLPSFRVLAPCPHAASCPALARDNDWCHFFAPPPPEVFTNGDWAKIARELGIDLRALPYAFLAVTRGPLPAGPPPPHRLLGRPDVRKHDARMQLCTSQGLVDALVDKRTQAAVWRTLKQHPDSLRTLPARDLP